MGQRSKQVANSAPDHGLFYHLKGAGPITIPLETKEIIFEFEIDYDTIPETGIRRSYRKIAYPLNWANGKSNAPLIEPNILDEWEK